jgi:hypothetical protein
MANSFLAWVSVISGVVVIVATVITAVKAVLEAKNLRRRDVKELLDLIDEAGNRFEKESANAWRNPEAKPPEGSFEDSLAKDLLVSQIFGRTITWSDWIEIRKFLTDHENVRFGRYLRNIDLLRYAWLYRDQTQAPHRCFRMTWRIRLNVLWYLSVSWVTLLLFCFGLMLVWISLIPAFLELLISLSPQLPKLLISFGIHSSNQLLVPGAEIMLFTLLIFIPNVIFNYDCYAARLICKKTESLAKQAKPLTSRFGIFRAAFRRSSKVIKKKAPNQ